MNNKTKILIIGILMIAIIVSCSAVVTQNNDEIITSDNVEIRSVFFKHIFGSPPTPFRQRLINRIIAYTILGGVLNG